jgi:predicted ATPase with chaperone activity
VYIPYSVLVRGEIITLFDQINHIQVDAEVSAESVDQRWVLVRRPVVRAGGELTLKTLDLDFNRVNRFYEAPLQMKANNGLLIVDDFGRQLVDPHILLNRWIVPLERSADYLTLHTGMKFEIPFDLLVIFATNIEPKELVDEAFLRRMPHKIRVNHPGLDQYREIFQKVCEINGIVFREDVLEYLVSHCYQRMNVSFSACHPRDLILQVIDNARYYGQPPEMTTESITRAWENYFVDL